MNKRNILIGLGALLLVIIIILIYMFSSVDVVVKYGITTTNAIKSGGGLSPGASIKGPGRTLAMQLDGNLVVYNTTVTPVAALKATYTMQPGNYLTLDNNGVLRIMGSDRTTVRWTGPTVSGTTGTWYLMPTNTGNWVALINPAGVATDINIGNL